MPISRVLHYYIILKRFINLLPPIIFLARYKEAVSDNFHYFQSNIHTLHKAIVQHFKQF